YLQVAQIADDGMGCLAFEQRIVQGGHAQVPEAALRGSLPALNLEGPEVERARICYIPGPGGPGGIDPCAGCGNALHGDRLVDRQRGQQRKGLPREAWT